MKAIAVFPSDREVRCIDHPEPVITGPNEVKLRILEAGICGTDREIASFAYGTPPASSPYLIIGHEALGRVVEVGNSVNGFVPGDLAVLMVRRPCSHADCAPCRAGRPDFCMTGDFTERGIKGMHGFMAEFVVDDEHYFVKVPPELRDIAVLTEPLTVAEKSAEQTRILRQRLPDDMRADPRTRHGVVIGAGPIGLLNAMKMVIAGINTWVYSRDSADSMKGRLVTSFGGRYIDSTEYSPAELAAMIGTISFMFEAVGNAGVTFDMMSVLGVNGIFIFTGIPALTGKTEIDAELIMRNLVLKNQVICGTVNAGRASFEEAIRDLGTFMQRFPDSLKALITERVSFDDACNAVLSKGGIKSVITM